MRNTWRTTYYMEKCISATFRRGKTIWSQVIHRTLNTIAADSRVNVCSYLWNNVFVYSLRHMSLPLFAPISSHYTRGWNEYVQMFTQHVASLMHLPLASASQSSICRIFVTLSISSLRQQQFIKLQRLKCVLGAVRGSIWIEGVCVCCVLFQWNENIVPMWKFNRIVRTISTASRFLLLAAYRSQYLRSFFADVTRCLLRTIAQMCVCSDDYYFH